MEHYFVNIYPSHACTIIKIKPWLFLFIITHSLSSQHTMMSSLKKSLSPSTPLFPFRFLATLHPIMLSYSLHFYLLCKNIKIYTNLKSQVILYCHKYTLKECTHMLSWCITTDLHFS